MGTPFKDYLDHSFEEWKLRIYGTGEVKTYSCTIASGSAKIHGQRIQMSFLEDTVLEQVGMPGEEYIQVLRPVKLNDRREGLIRVASSQLLSIYLMEDSMTMRVHV